MIKEVGDIPLVVAATTSTSGGAVLWLDWIPSNIDKLGTLVGIIGTLVGVIGVILLGYTRIMDNKRKQELHNLDIEERRRDLTK